MNIIKNGLYKRIAFTWGLAEATFFFIVPDLYISYKALDSLKIAYRACVFTLLGALLGGTIMFIFAYYSPESALNAIQYVPGVNNELIEEARSHFNLNGSFAVYQGPVNGVPYKIYAVLAPIYNVNYFHFIILSVFARVIRFILVASAVSLMSNLVGNRIKRKYKIILLLMFWLLFYIIYFYKIIH